MGDYDNIVKGPNGFSYEAFSMKGPEAEVRIRDSRDELFAIARYNPNSDHYEISLDLGFNGRGALRQIGLLKLLDLTEFDVPDMTGMLGAVDPSEIDNYKHRTYGKIQDDDDIFEFENIDQEDEKTPGSNNLLRNKHHICGRKTS